MKKWLWLLGLLIAHAAIAEPAPSGPDEGEASTDAAAPEDAGPAASPDLPTVPVDEGAPAAAPPESGTQLDEVVVTARKRAESLQDVPLSVTAASGEALRDRGGFDIRSAARNAANVQMQSSDAGHTFTYIRGIGTRRYDPGVDQSVATFVDGVYHGRSFTTNTDLLNVDRVEILKGPQGTLYGKNTIGGAISVVTAPAKTDAWGGKLVYEPGIGSISGDSLQNFSGLASGPLLDDVLGVSVALSKRKRDGYLTVLDTDPPTGRPRDDVKGGADDQQGGKLRLDWTLTDDIDLTLTGSTTKLDDAPIFFSPNDHGDPNAQILSQNPAIPRPQFTRDPRAIASEVPELFLRTTVNDESVHLGWHRDNLSILSISGFEQSKYRESNDLDGTALDVLRNLVDEAGTEFTEELRFEFDWERVHLLAGLFYSKEGTDRFEELYAGQDSYLSSFSSPDPLKIDFRSVLHTTSKALFGQASWSITPKLEVTGGLRESEDRKTAHLVGVNNATVPKATLAGTLEEYDFMDVLAWRSLDPMISVKYRVFDDTMAYVTGSTGYKSGGFQWLALTEDNARKTFNPEHVTNVELGTKSTFLERHLRLNAALFQMAYKDLQLVTFDASAAVPVAVSGNVAQSTIRGAEVEGAYLFESGFALDFSCAYLDAVFKDYVQDPGDPSTQRAGNELSRAPKWSLGVAPGYTTYLGPGVLHARIGYSWRDKFYWEPDNDSPPRDQVEAALGQLDASLGYKWGKFSVNVWGSNLTDKVYREHVVDLGPTSPLGTTSVNYDFFGAPRTIGAQFGVAIE